MDSKPSGKIEFIPIEHLLLDKENPRFAGTYKPDSQKEIAKYLWEEMYLDELLLSIAVNGYYVQEPLLIVKKNERDYIVIEGNRRLATVKILLDPELAKYVGARSSDIPQVDDEIKSTLITLPVIIFKERTDLWKYLTFRHINGPRTWSSLSKAEYISHLHLEKNLDFDLILKSMGDKGRYSIKLFNALMILRQGESITRFKRDDITSASLNFSHLYTIIGYPTTQKYLGIDKYKASEIFPQNPVPETKKNVLEELLTWIFGSKSSKQPSLIKSQNPDLRMLDDVIGNIVAVEYLREGHDLQGAHEFTKQEDRRFESYIIKAELNIRKAKGIDDSYKGDSSLKQRLENIIVIAQEINKKMKEYKQDE